VELGFKTEAKAELGAPMFAITPDGFNCSVDLKSPGGKSQQWSIRQDSLIKRVPAP